MGITKVEIHSMTLICANCSNENPADAGFCQKCGQPLMLDCATCGRSNTHEALFCRHCGTRLDGVSVPGSESRLRSLQETAPQELREKIKAARTEIEGERKPVTILFTDIVGSTAIAEKLDPEVWKEIVVGAHRRVGKAVYRYEGTIAQLLGDGVLAFFGAPITHEDDPIRAVHAAMDIQESVKDYTQELGSTVDNFQMRIGISTGTVVIGEIGTDMHVEYLAIGDAVNVAARLQSAAEPGKVVVSKPCARLVSAKFELKDLGEIAVKGKAEPLQAFELISVKAEPETGRGVEGLPTPYVGRAQEVEKLQSSLLALCDGHGQIVTVMGDAGIGKTRLLEEVKAITCETEGDREATKISPSSIRWLEGRALSYGGSLSYWTITQLLLADLGLSDGAPQVKIKVALRQRVRELFGEAKCEQALPYLAHILGLKGEGEAEEHIQSLDGETLKKRMLKSVSDYFSHVADEGPTVLVFEDMHWADPSSLEALESLLPLTDRVPLMILMLMRVERDHGSWGVKLKVETDFPHRTTEIYLRSLSEGDSSSLLEQLLGATKLPEEIWRTIMERSEGNPFYLEEVVRHLMERDLIVEDEEGWRATKELEAMSIPDTLQGVLLARIDRLEEDVRRTLQMAAVIGKSFLYRILETIAEAEVQLDTHLSQLQRVDLVREKARIPELEYIFKHTMTQEAAYNSLLHERRKVFHLKVGEALEELFPDRVDEFSGLMAYHFEAAEAREKAVDYLGRAGDQARLAYAHQEAIDFYERALVILKGQEAYDHAARTLMKLGLTYHTAFDFQRSRRAYDEAFAMRQRERTSKQETLEPAPHSFRLVEMDPPTLDPSIFSDSTSGAYIMQIFSGLVELGMGWEIMPDVAQSWEISEDGLRYVFHLRDDVYWSDGTQVTARDFVYSWIRSLNPGVEAPSGKARLFYDIKNARAYHNGELPKPDQVGVMAVDKLTLEVELERAASYFLHILFTLYPVPRHVVETYGDAWTDVEHIVTNGPFQIESYQPAESMYLVRNPTYHGEFSGNVERVEVKFGTSMGSPEAIELYERDKVDITELTSETYHERHRLAEEYLTGPEQGTYVVGFDASRPPFDDVRVRQAFIMAVDREKLPDEVLDGYMYPAMGGYVPPTIPGHSPGIGLPYDPIQARQLMTQAGYPDGQGFPPLEIIFSDRWKNMAERLKAQWLVNLNVGVALEITDWENVLRTFLSRNAFFMGWSADYPDPDCFLRVGVRGLLPGWRNDKYDQLLESARKAIEQNDRIDLYQAADKILIGDAVIMPMAYGKDHLLCKPWVKPPGGFAGTWYFKDFILEPH
ncbi:MAG: ABC transporter substrate-binding protein [Anaerolineales bacterium]|nr:ABC transporter substrate-binding protein [Anaerolineales bacterium]